MKHLYTQPIRTSRLLLRRFTMDDAEAMYRNWTSDDQVSKYVTWDTHRDIDATRETVSQWVSQYAEEDFYNWVLEYEGEIIGNVHACAMYPADNSCEVGYCTGRRWWGRGLAAEALEAATAFLFGKVGLHRIWLCHEGGNPNSGRVMQKCGYRLEGVFRESRKRRDGTYTDLVFYAMLREEWEKRSLALEEDGGKA